jgi:hypothetical protein
MFWNVIPPTSFETEGRISYELQNHSGWTRETERHTGIAYEL